MKRGIAIIMSLGLLIMGSMAVPVFAADATLAAMDKKFLMKAAMGGLMEVQFGQMAKEKAQSQEVKDFGSMMVTDHGKANDELKQIAQQKKVTMPTKLDQKHKSLIDKVAKASGPEFDKKYMQEMVKDHAKDVAKFRKASEQVQDPDLKGWATKTLPTLEQHLQQAKDIAQKVGVDVNKAQQEGEKEAEKKEKSK